MKNIRLDRFFSIWALTSLFVAPVALASADYYDQFRFEVKGSCSKTKISPLFNSAATYGEAALGSDPQGREELVELDLQLFSDHTYWLHYEEQAVMKRKSSTGYYYDILFKQNFEGSWSVKDDRLEIGDLGFATPTKLTLSSGERNGLRFQFTRAPHDIRALNITMNIIRVTGTNIGPKGVSIAQYCGESL